MNILLVDDNPDYLFLLKEALYSRGYTVQTAEDGIRGCEMLIEADFDLFISDIKMPRFDGIRLHSFAREIDRYNRTKFLFISGFWDSYAGKVKLDPECDFFLPKTTPLNELIAYIDKLLFGNFAGMWV